MTTPPPDYYTRYAQDQPGQAAQPSPLPTAQPQQPPAPQPQQPPAPQTHRPQTTPSWAADGPSREHSSEVSDVRVLSARQQVAEKGLRGVVNRLLGMNLSRSEAEVEMDQWVSQINLGVRHPKVIGVVSPKGGVGKTSTLQLLGSALSQHRSSTGAVGVDIDASSLLLRRMKPLSKPNHGSSISTFVRDPHVDSRTDVDAYLTVNAEGFAVLPGTGITGDSPLTVEEMVSAIHRLSDHYPLILLDFPGSARESAVAQEALRWIDGMIFVSSTKADSLTSGKHMLNQLSKHRPDLLKKTLVLLNRLDTNKVLVDLESQVAEIIRIMQPDSDDVIFEVGYDSHIAEADELSLGLTDDTTQRRFAQIAARLMEVLPRSEVPLINSAGYHPKP